MRPVALALTAGVALALIGALWFAKALATVPVGVVRVAGDLGAAEREQVEAAIDRELAKRSPAARAVAGAVGALGWVREVRVCRQWPDALVIEVAPETLAARWGSGGWLTASGRFVADHRGHASAPRDLPTFDAVHADGREAMRVFETVNAAASAGGLTVAGIEEDQAGGWTAVFDGGMRVVLGREDLGVRTRRFVHVYRRALRYAETIALADARYGSGVAVLARESAPPANLLAATGIGRAADPDRVD